VPDTELSPEESAALIAYARQKFAQERYPRSRASAGARGARQARPAAEAGTFATGEALRAEPGRAAVEEATVGRLQNAARYALKRAAARRPSLGLVDAKSVPEIESGESKFDGKAL
jgi:hypothetical protein